jgi:hypothetical protein
MIDVLNLDRLSRANLSWSINAPVDISWESMASVDLDVDVDALDTALLSRPTVFFGQSLDCSGGSDCSVALVGRTLDSRCSPASIFLSIP